MENCKTCVYWRFKSSSDDGAVGVCDNPDFPSKARIGAARHLYGMLKVGLYEFERAAQPYITLSIPEDFGCIHHTPENNKTA